MPAACSRSYSTAPLRIHVTQLTTASLLATPGDCSMTSFVFIALGLALTVAVFTAGREMRLRKALEKLIQILLSHWRKDASKSQSHDVDPLDHTIRRDTRM